MKPYGIRPSRAPPRKVRTIGDARFERSNIAAARAARIAAAVSRKKRGIEFPDEEDILNSGLAVKDADLRTIRAWVVFQLVSLAVQWQLWREVKAHLELYDQALLTQCAPSRQQHGVCLGPMWNLSAWENVALEGQWSPTYGLERSRMRSRSRQPSRGGSLRGDMAVIDREISDFEAVEHDAEERLKDLRRRKAALESAANSSMGTVPPTFLVAVTPVTKARRAHEAPPEENLSVAETEELTSWPWSITVIRTNPPQAVLHPGQEWPGERPLHQRRQGSGVLTIEDMSPEASQTMGSRGSVTWRATLVNRGYTSRKSRFLVFVEDSTVPHLESIRSNSRCSFTRSWKAFIQQRQGRSHENLIGCRVLLGFFLPVGAVAILIVFFLSSGDPKRDCCDGYTFHTVVIMKFILMDLPQQICIVLYLLGWYEAEGLRCQLCLFHPGHCEEEHPFGFPNSLAIACTLMSSISNQLLVRPAWKRFDKEEDAGAHCRMRFAVACMSTLPFTTGAYWASSTVLSTPVLVQVIVFLPCMVGWLTAMMSGILLCHNCCQN
eukprot:TRINITY_DN30449_c0_g1_i1.p1 TRINITY_DN30449_c0_g1~~TRINITY_DN30449_c0_g1_i1.p1  ORF type:complete len:583 (-),score=82.00 TRINITY_DN30449_c0_g1_i1:302-1951(-)